jgi:hypothetical protein
VYKVLNFKLQKLVCKLTNVSVTTIIMTMIVFRGDVMCQDALTELKMRIRATGEHKQKIQIQVTVDGLKIKDEKSGVTFLFTWS